MNDKIAQYVHETMKGYGVSDRKLERELILACRDEYEMRLADGAYEDEAFKAAVENIEEIAKSRIPRRAKYCRNVQKGAGASQLLFVWLPPADSNCLIDALYFAYVFPCKTLLGPATQAILSIHTLSVKKTLYFLSSKKTAHHNRGSIAV